MLTILDFDNSGSKIAARLLEMYPVELLKEEYAQKGHSADVIEGIIKQTTLTDLKDDALRLMGRCRQHVFVFQHDLKSGKLPSKVLTQNIEYENLSVDEADRKEIEYLILTKFHFVEIKGESAIPRYSFNWWPVKIVIEPGYLQLRITISERHNKSSGDFLFRSRNIDEESIVGGVFGAMDLKAGFCPADLNKGLKKIWELDIVDSKFVTRKTSKSVDTSLMDQGFTFKKDSPARYKELLTDPLRKSVFQVAEGNVELPATFAIDAEEGFVAFRSFPGKVDAVDKLMNLLLKHN